MAKKNSGNKARGFPPAPTPAQSISSSASKQPIRWGLITLFLTITIGGTYLAVWLRPSRINDDGDRFTYKVVTTYPHDANAFTQGLVVDQGFLWEGTGRYGQSSIRKTELKTGKILQQHDLDKKYFGEGVAIVGDQIFQLTWKSGIVFVYDHEFNLLKQIKYKGQGWGLATNGTDLIFSDGTAEIKFLDPATFQERRSIRVRRKGLIPVGELNELEYSFVNEKIYANCFQTDLVYEIDPESGDVTKIIDLSGLWPERERPAGGVLNGIAINPKTGSLLVTGKLCPKIFELRLFPAKR